jgi:cobalt-zinc-cadmium efflux system membrane fusion protein
MSGGRDRRRRTGFVIGLGGAALFGIAACGGHKAAPKVPASSSSPGKPISSIEVLPRVATLTGLTTAVVKKPTQPRILQMRGSLALDVNRLVHVHARFPGQVVHLETIEVSVGDSETAPKVKRTLNFMDRVAKGQKLGQIWSKDLGEKKSELVDSLIRLRIDEQNLKYQKELLRKGATAEKAVREAERQVEVGEIAVAKAERTLRSWSIKEGEIRELKKEADRIHEGGTRDIQQDESWASVEIISPIDGTIVEKNVVEGDIVNADSDLFKVADLSVLSVWARIYEEDIPLLHSMPKPITWTLHISSNPQSGAIQGTIDRIGEIIDPNEHMALLAGQVKNPNDQLHAGQMITAIVELPPEEDVVEIPTRALVEDGDESVIFVQDPADGNRFTMRRVSVVRRHFDRVYVRSRLEPGERTADLEELHEGESVVAAGALELKAALQEQHVQ